MRYATTLLLSLALLTSGAGSSRAAGGADSISAGDLREWLLNIICYLLEKGPVLKDGETLGMTAEQKIRIRHCKSSFGHPGQILRLEP